MNAARKSLITAVLATSLLAAAEVQAATQLLLSRSNANDHAGEWKGVVDLTIDPGFDNAKVTVSVDGQKVADSLKSPYHLVVDLGNTAVQHKITVTAQGPNGRRAQWHETINRGMLPLSVKVNALDVAAGLFEVDVTTPKDDPIKAVELWDDGKLVARTETAPYRFNVPASVVAKGFVQVTAKTARGDEAADFWSPAGDVHVEQISVRTVPIFVSVVDRNGHTHDDVDRSHFRIVDNNTEAKIIEFGKAFDQPISIALLLDASASMTYAMQHAAKAANDFVQTALKEGDRCSVIAVQDVPRRKQALTGDRELVAKALHGIRPEGRTALFDAIATALRELKGEKNRRAIVVLTDGGDTASMLASDELEKVTREAGIPVYFIAYEGSDEPRDLDRLKYIAAETGGFVATATQQNLVQRYAMIEKDLRAQFAILYQVTDYQKANEYRRVRVTIKSPTLEARTIRGYFTE